MKKYVILTSVLALAACGGGSSHHGGGAAPIVPDAPADVEKPFVPQKDYVADSNAEITSMVSNSEAQVVTYVVDKLGEDAASVGLGNAARTATTRGAFVPSPATGNMDYDRAKELMELAQWLGDSTTTHDDITAMFNKSKTDQNKIKSALKLLDDMYCYVGGSADETATRILERRAAKDFEKPMAEIKEKSEILVLRDVVFTMSSASLGDEDGGKDELTFDVDKDGRITGINFKTYAPNKKGELVAAEEGSFSAKRPDDDKNAFEIHQERKGSVLTGDVTLKTYGKDIGLKYSDFGALVGTITETTPGHAPESGMAYEGFAGGYANKKIDVADMSGKMDFAGRAIGTVQGKNGGDDLALDGDATLHFNNGAETLSLAFDNWYDIRIEKNGNQGDIYFTNGDAISDKDVDYKFDRGDEFSTKNFISGDYNGKVDNDENGQYGKIDINYYGNDGNPIEATGVLQYVEDCLQSGDDAQIRANMAFGVVKQ